MSSLKAQEKWKNYRKAVAQQETLWFGVMPLLDQVFKT